MKQISISKQVLLYIVVIAAMLVPACMENAPPADTPIPWITPPAMTVSITDESCPNMEVQAGLTVVWVNAGKKEHILQSELQEDGSRIFDSGILQPGDAWSITFDTPGTISYLCSEDGSLRGTITVTSSNMPAAPVLPQLGSGVAHSCLLSELGNVYCWGLGPMETPVVPSEDAGKLVSLNFADATALAAGWYHTCAVMRTGRVQCWGQNASGQLGDGSTKESPSPVDVIDLGGIVSVTAGAYHTCALTQAGEVYCWGLNSSGQLGDGTKIDRSTPVPVLGLSGPAASIEAGSLFTCALSENGPVECWGEFGFVPLEATSQSPPSELVTSNVQVQTQAVPIINLEGEVLQIAAGNYHLCVLKKTKEVECEGMIVSPDMPPFTGADQNLGELQGHIQQVLAETDFNCVLTDSGEVYCWGDNYFGQLGDGTFTNSSEPIQVNTGRQESVSLGGGHYTACALLSDGGVKCWGDTSFGQLGDGTARWK